MCGFVGFIDHTENKEIILKEMLQTLIHRGPDSEGQHIDDDLALGFRRLSIVDLSSHGNQPMYNENGNLVLTFNGEIYNYKELQKELIKAGHIFESDTDSEVLLHGYEQWGKGLVDRLRGMFAFAVYDREKKQLFAARDIFGIKPFYYTKMKDTFLFGSEIKAFLPHPNFVKEFQEELLGLYLSFQFVPSNETFFKNVFCLPPAHFLTYDGQECKIACYYKYNFGTEERPASDMAAELEEVLKDSIEAHKSGDVEIGSYLSSGVDSSYLAYMGQVDKTFTVGFEGGSSNEIDKAKEFADNIQIWNSSKTVTAEEYWDAFSDIQYYMDEPVADPAAVGLYFLSKEASKQVKVVFSGEGSDELFGGYNIYCEPMEHSGFDKIPMPVRRMLGMLAERVLPRGIPGRGFLMRHGKTLEERYFSNATNIFTEREAEKILKNGCGMHIQDITRPLYENIQDKDPVTKMQYIDLHLWLVHDILMKGDKMGMANSVEVRVPFLDKKVWQFARNIPLEYKVSPPRTKILFREVAARVIRKETADKKKLGFPVPIRTWIKEDTYYRKIKEAFLSESAQKFFDTDRLVKMLDCYKKGRYFREKTDDSRKIWTVYTFLVWYDRFFSEA